MAKVRMDRRSAGQWRALVLRQAGGDESVARFCAREQVNVASFYQWRARVRGADAAAVVSQPESTAGGFVDLGAVRLGAGGYILRLDLGGGLVLSLTRG